MDEIFKKAPWVFYLLLPVLFVSMPIINILGEIQNKPAPHFTTH